MGIQLDSIKDPRLRNVIASKLAEAAGCPNKDCSLAPTAPTKRIRQDQKPLLNKLEQEYFNLFLFNERNVCSQSVRFMLANGLWYKPDFFCPYRMVGIEVKGPHAFRGGFENLKMAAHQYPWIKWLLVWKHDSDWQEQTVLP